LACKVHSHLLPLARGQQVCIGCLLCRLVSIHNASHEPLDLLHMLALHVRTVMYKGSTMQSKIAESEHFLEEKLRAARRLL
jgi:hypothetical protein